MSGATVEHVDVVIVGAGLSGIGAGCHLQRRCPDKTFAILEARGESGGTWDLFRYPGVRSDSDMFTLAYDFRPWTGTKAIGDGPSILRYIRETARDRGIEPMIRYHRRAVKASWSSAEARWTVEVECVDTGATEEVTCGFLFANTGYYRYDAGYTPDFAGRENFTGRIVHPQEWPGDLDCSGQRVVVIGSGATAVTLVPALARTARHVTMLQRSPSYVASVPESDPLDELVRGNLPPAVARRLVRWKNMVIGWLIFQLSRNTPKLMKGWLLRGVAGQLPDGYDVGTHFTPDYQPWDQRLCLAPDGDLFVAISEGRASVVTDRIDSFCEKGILLGSGAVLEADVIVTATGLSLLMLGGMAVSVDGRPVDVAEAVTHKSVLLCGVPNLAFTFGYTNASWTLKSDLVARYVCRLLAHMDAGGYDTCTAVGPDPSMPTAPYLDLSSGYVRRSAATFTRQGTKAPWRVRHNYPLDVLMFRYGRLDDEVAFSRSRPVGEPRLVVKIGDGRDPIPQDVRARQDEGEECRTGRGVSLAFGRRRREHARDSGEPTGGGAHGGGSRW
ncbi:MAG TPA: NAD(P)/FAD-dependent oxidoreductase [Acidimicrobiales bacterium]|nr:NAD(P)/FAD-dependent oxidoreductase [Acidimicrobiales bacterium]